MSHVVIRHYNVILRSDAQTLLDVIPVTLSYSLADARSLPRDGAKAMREAFDRAVVLARRDGAAPSQSFMLVSVSPTRERLVASDRAAFSTALKLAEANARRKARAKARAR